MIKVACMSAGGGDRPACQPQQANFPVVLPVGQGRADPAPAHGLAPHSVTVSPPLPAAPPASQSQPEAALARPMRACDGPVVRAPAQALADREGAGAHRTAD